MLQLSDSHVFITCIIFLILQSEVNVSLPLSTINNGTLFAHIFIGPSNLSPNVPKNYGKFKVVTVSLTRYHPPTSTEFNLVTGEYEVYLDGYWI